MNKKSFLVSFFTYKPTAHNFTANLQLREGGHIQRVAERYEHKPSHTLRFDHGFSM